MMADPFADPLRPTRKEANCESHFVRVNGRPGNQAFQLYTIVANGADFYQFRLNNVGISHEVNASTWSALTGPAPASTSG